MAGHAKTKAERAAKAEAMPKSTTVRGAELNAAANKLIAMAKKGGTEQNYFFQTVFEKYLEQQAIMADIQARMLQIREQLKMEGLPLNLTESLEKRLLQFSSEFSKQSTASNNTVQTLLKIIVTFAEGSVMHDGEESTELDL